VSVPVVTAPVQSSGFLTAANGGSSDFSACVVCELKLGISKPSSIARSANSSHLPPEIPVYAILRPRSDGYGE